MRLLEVILSNIEKFIATRLPFIYCFLKRCKVKYQTAKYHILKNTKGGKDVIYNDSFFKRNLEWNVPVAERMVDILIKYFNPKTVVDVGCGNAEFIYHFQKRGIDIKGYDGSSNAINNALVDKKFLELYDLKDKIITQKRYELALCLEVAEHIENKYSKSLIENLTNLSDLVVFTAAPPGQGGHFHINEQPKEFWVSIFEGKKYFLDTEITEKVKNEMKEKDVIWWYYKNLMIFRLMK